MTITNRFRKNRRAFTLIETVYVVSAETVVAALGIGILLLATEIRNREYQGDSARMAAGKIAETYRADVRTAIDAVIDGDRLQLTLPDGEQVDYTIETTQKPGKSTICRKHRRNKIRIAQEHFAVPDHSTTWFVRGEGPQADRVVLSIWTPPVDRRGNVLVPMPDKERLNPLTREAAADAVGFEPRDAANWRTIIGKLSAPETK